MLSSAATQPAAVRLGRADTFALTVGSKLTVSTLMIACVLAIVVGASSLLDSMQAMDKDLKIMSRHLETSNTGVAGLGQTMKSLPPTNEHLQSIVGTIDSTSAEVKRSGTALAKLNARTTTLNNMVSDIATATATTTEAHKSNVTEATRLSSTVDALAVQLPPVVGTQRSMLAMIRQMTTAMGDLNASLAYVVRTLNYISAPPTGRGFTANVELDKSTLPPVPGVHAKAQPVEVYPRNAWPVYRGL